MKEKNNTKALLSRVNHDYEQVRLGAGKRRDEVDLVVIHRNVVLQKLI